MEELRKDATKFGMEPVTPDGNPTSEGTYVNDIMPESNHKLLGQTWNTTTDVLTIDLTKILTGVNADVVTKRIILSTTAKFYDPLGFISPVVLMFKLLFQQLCKDNSDWDDALDEEMTQKWQLIIDSLNNASEFALDRCYCKELCSEEVKSVQLHAFGDASDLAYGACVYLRCEHRSGVHCNLVAAKTRIAPMAKQTIPRLELLACLLASRLLDSVKKALDEVLNIEYEILWTDSTTALHWIRNSEKEYKVWVQNRVTGIRQITSTATWRYCPTQSNPADVASRGALAVQLINDNKWWHGPNFLQDLDESWPVEPFKEHDNNPDYCEEFKSNRANPISTLTNVESSTPECSLGNLIDPTRFSTYGTIMRVTAYVLRFVRNIQRSFENLPRTKVPLTAEEISSAEKSWIRQLEGSIPKMKDYKKTKESLSLFEDDENIIRCRGRIEASPLPYDTKFPILLPSDHHITRLIIMQSHEDVFHNGVRETLTQLRSRFWVTKGRQVVKKLIAKCNVCRKLEGKGYGIPASPDLPDFRLSNDFAFTRIGVDYAGPLYVKDIYAESKDMYKGYIALYTCASSRATHLDLVPDNTTSSFVKSFKRFIGRRGIPSLVVSDNGKTFKSAQLRNFILHKKIKWHFIVEGSPWWGGFYERMKQAKQESGNI